MQMYFVYPKTTHVSLFCKYYLHKNVIGAECYLFSENNMINFQPMAKNFRCRPVEISAVPIALSIDDVMIWKN